MGRGGEVSGVGGEGRRGRGASSVVGEKRTMPLGPKVLLTRSAMAIAPMKEACE